MPCSPALFLLLPLLTAAPPADPPADIAPIRCDSCEAWNQPQAPFRVFGDTFYVGTRGLASLVIDSGDGLILLDGAMPQSAEPIAANLRTLGLDVRRVKWILNSHSHFDHAGGIAALQRMSGAQVATSPDGARALRLGGMLPEDPQAGEAANFPAVRRVTPLADGATLKLGHVVVTAHHTPGHTPGGTTWTWRSCEGERCVDMVYADSMTAISGPRFRYSAHPAAVKRFREGIATIRALPCDILVHTHPSYSDLFTRQAASVSAGREAFLAPGACQAYADRADKGLTARLESEAAKPPDAP